jgi:hypothetical protein
MTRNNLALGWWTATVLACLAGCNQPAGSPRPKGEEEVRQTFTALQRALEGKDADKVWALLDEDSQADAEREARGIRDAYAKAAPAERAEQAKELGLPGAGLASLKGPGFLKTRRFLGKYDEIPGSKITRVEIKGDKAVVSYLEPDGDREKLTLVRQAGQWKVSVPMPKGVRP